MADILQDKHVVVSASTLAYSIEQRCRMYSENRLWVDTPPTIYRVHKSLRQEDQDSYDPKLISIGPIHRNRPELMQMEPIKWKYLGDLIRRNPETNTVGNYVHAVWKHEQRARGQYSVQIDLPAEEFVEMLVLDGCFILEFFIKRAVGKVGSPWKDAKWNLPLLRNDLLLLENQIPFFVLEILYDISDIPFPGEVSLAFLDLALHYLSKGSVREVPSSEIHHLLHLSYLCQMRYFEDTEHVKIHSSKCEVSIFKRPISNMLATIFYFLVSLLLMCERPRHNSSKKSGNRKAPRVVPCTTNLQQAGVTFKRKEGQSYLNVAFTEEGTLEIPFLPIQQNTVAHFRNLIAFEQCCRSVGNQFTAYATFMDQIIDTPEDVAILEKHKIIESKLGSDEDVARIFNGICKGASLDYDDHYLKQMFKKINRHCESDRNRWRAQLIQGYFRNPWAVASAIAATILLVLTILQTLFAVLSYWK